MTEISPRRTFADRVLRDRHVRGQQVTFVELFFDLVFVFAVTQLSHRMLAHLDLHTAAETLLLLLAVWWSWMYTSWATNWFDPDRLPVRLMLFGVMLASLVMSAALPNAFGAGAAVFAVAYVAIQVGRTTFVVLTLGRRHELTPNFERILAWCSITGVLWLVGGFGGPAVRLVAWPAALILDYLAPTHGFRVPGLGRSRTSDWTIEGGHLAERCQLFVIIAFGESILATGATFSSTTRLATAGVLAFAVAFLGNAALWWIYFDRAAEGGSERIANSGDPGRLGRSAYTYFHLPMVAGIIVCAVADERVIAHPGGHPSTATVVVTLAGPALYLLGTVLFKAAIYGRLSTQRLLAVAALAALAPVGMAVPALVLASAATLVVLVLAAWETLAYRQPRLPVSG